MEFLQLLQDIRSPVLDILFLAVTFLGSETIVISLVCVLYWCVNKRLAYQMGLVFFVSGMIVQTMKITFRIDRPWIRNPDLTPAKSAGATGYSFPSGHTQSGTALFGTFATKFAKKQQKIICVIIILLIGFSRMYLGVHTPIDVLFGMLVSALTIILVSAVFGKLYDTRKYDIFISGTLFVISCAVIAVALVLLSKGYITANYVNDCCKAAGAGIGLAVAFYIERKYINFETKTKEFWMQPMKFSFGMTGILIIKQGVKYIIGESITANIIRYAMIVIFALALYPMLIKKLNKKQVA